MPLNCPYQTRFIQQYSTIIDCLGTSVPVQTQSADSNWFVDDELQSIAVGSLTNVTGAVKNDGTLWLWGDLRDGLGGDNDNSQKCSPVQTVSATTCWKQVSFHGFHAAAIKTDGTLWLWGCNGTGELGNGTRGGVGSIQSSPVQTVSTTTNWKQVAVGQDYSGAIKTDGTLWMWGDNQSGKLGINIDSTVVAFLCSPAQTIACGTNWKQLSLGRDFVGAIKTDGTLWTWGRAQGLGNYFNDSSSPIQTIATGTNWKQVSMGQNHGAAIKIDGTLWLWGDPGFGQLGNNANITDPVYSSPVQTVTTGTNWKQIATGDGNSAAVKTDGTLWLWGKGSGGALGNNAVVDRCSPLQTITTGTNWKSVRIGIQHTIANKFDGTLWTWGQGSSGKLGDGTAASKSSPVQTIAATTTWTYFDDPVFSLSLGVNQSAAVKSDGTLWLWGCNSFGEIGNNSTIRHSSPVQTVSATTNWKQVSLSNLHSAAIKTDGTLWLWGNGSCGRLGNNNTVDVSSPIQTVTTGTNWKQVALGAVGHSAAIKTDGTLWLWGCNDFGQLGINNSIDRSSPVQTVSATTNWKQVNLGFNSRSAAIKTDGTLWLWGLGAEGALGTNNITNQSSPVQTISATTNWKQVSLGLEHSAAIKTDGTLWLWGNGGTGALGNNAAFTISSPVQTVSTDTNWKQVSAACQFTSAIKTDGTLWSWGRNTCGRIGNNSTIDRSSPVQTVCTGIYWKELPDKQGMWNSAAISADNRLYIWGTNIEGQLGCNLSAGSVIPIDLGNILLDKEYLLQVYPNLIPNMKAPALWGWGSGIRGQLGYNDTVSVSSPIQTISNGTNWYQVEAGCAYSAAIKTDGTLWLWGCNGSGQLGNNSLTNVSSPVQTVSPTTCWRQVSVGPNRTAAIKTDGTLWLWGTGQQGELGNNAISNRSSPVQTVSATTNWKQVSVASTHSAAVKTDGTLWTWGQAGNGKLGDNAGTNRSSPVQTVSATTNWKQVSLGTNHSAAIKTDGTLWVWGSGSTGVLGTNNTISHSSPVQTVSTDNNWKQVSLFTNYSAAIKTDGTLWLWGTGTDGKLGNNAASNQSSPVQTVSTGTNWKQVSVGSANINNIGAIKTDGTLWMWGNGAGGELGNNDTINYSSPIQTVSSGTDWKYISVGGTHSFAIRESYDW